MTSGGAGIKMSRLVALAAYAYQSVAGLLLVACLGRILPPLEYSIYSLTLASAQFAAIGAFEWIKLAASRFCPSSGPRSGRQHATLLGEFFACAGVLVGLALVVMLFSQGHILLAAGIAVGQGFTDLQFSFARSRGDLALFSRLQSLRATFLLLFSCGFGAMFATATATLAGLVSGYAASIVIGLCIDREILKVPMRAMTLHFVPDHLRYGGSAATASVLHLMAPLALRYSLVSIFGLRDSAGINLALDFLQRPFVVVVTALYGIFSPPVVASFDNDGPDGANPAIWRLYQILILPAIFLLGVILALAPELSIWVAAPGLREGFLSAVFSLSIMMTLRSVLQNAMAVPAHLTKTVSVLIRNALADCIAMVGTAHIAQEFLGPAFFLPGAALGAAAAFAIGIYGTRLIKTPLPWRAMALVAMSVTLMDIIIALAVPSNDRLLSVALKATFIFLTGSGMSAIATRPCGISGTFIRSIARARHFLRGW